MTIRDHFLLDPAVTFLNHGSFGACPRVVLEAQARLRAQLEREPVRFLHEEIEARIDQARAALAAFVGADPAELAFVSNATSGVNAVLRSLQLQPGDELLVTDHGYNACRNAVEWAAGRAGAVVVVAKVPFPIASEDEVVEAVLGAVTPRTRLAIVDHVTSPSGLVFPLRRLVAGLEGNGIDVLVDGAHAPGMLPLDLTALDAAYYTGNCHKWMCAPKGAAFLFARRDRQRGLVPAVISHGMNDPRSTRSRFHLLFDWVGTTDPTAWLCVPEAIAAVAALLPGGWPEVRAHNHRLALEARALFADAGYPPAAPESMIGSLVSFRLGPGDPLELHGRFVAAGFQVPVYPFFGERVLRISAAIYNELSDARRLLEAVPRALAPSG